MKNPATKIILVIILLFCFVPSPSDLNGIVIALTVADQRQSRDVNHNRSKIMKKDDLRKLRSISLDTKQTKQSQHDINMRLLKRYTKELLHLIRRSIGESSKNNNTHTDVGDPSMGKRFKRSPSPLIPIRNEFDYSGNSTGSGGAGSVSFSLAQLIGISIGGIFGILVIYCIAFGIFNYFNHNTSQGTMEVELNNLPPEPRASA